ncbi:MAG: hypothetical protein ACOX6N_00080 [Patescibacteria group bacterium]|jgi:hypothetical protein
MVKGSSGLSLIEIILITSVVSTILIAIIITINPIEQIKKGQDASTTNYTSEIFSSISRYHISNSKPLFTFTINTKDLESPEAQDIAKKLVQSSELKDSVIDPVRLPPVLLTANPSPLSYSLCFRPQSKSFRNNPKLCFYNSSGSILTDTSDCYICFTHNSTSNPPEQNSPGELSPTPNLCGHDPEYPNYPTTSFFLSDKFSIYGCDRYQVQDFSCDSYVWWTWGTPCESLCQPGQRCLKKKYSHPNIFSSDGFNCLIHYNEAVEYYCTNEPYSNCLNHPQKSSPDDFEHGCTNPVRSIKWKTP